MSLYERVPQIELSPAYADRPLSALRPRDYARLLWDLFYFPQKVRDYVSAFAWKSQGEHQPPTALSRMAWRGWAESNPIQLQFLFMVAVLCIAAILVVVSAASFLTAAIAGTEWAYGATGWAILVGFGASIFMLACGMAARTPGTLAVFALPIGLAMALVFLSFDIAPRYGLDDGLPALMILCFLCGAAFGLASAGFFAAESTGWNNMALQVSVGAVVGLVIAMAVGFTGWRDPASSNGGELGANLGEILLIGATAFGGFLLAALRVDDYLLHGRFPGKAPDALSWQRMPRATSIPVANLHDHLTAWLDFDWQKGMDNAVSIWWYSAQQETVRRAIHEILKGEGAKKPDAGGAIVDKQFAIIGCIADKPRTYPWDLVTYDNAARSTILGIRGRQKKAATEKNLYAQRRIRRQQLRQRAVNKSPVFPLPDKSPEQAITAGFWYLDKGYIANAQEAFKKAPDSPAVKEMRSIVEALNTLSVEENLLANPNVKLPARPADARRNETWDALDKLRTTLRYARIARQSVSAEKKEHAADEAKRLLGELASDKNNQRVELRQIRRLAELWEADLDESLSGAEKQPVKAVEIPFVFAEPLRKSAMFVDRDAELADLKTAWKNENLQPVILFGQPLIGKTSLLYAAAAANAHVELAWFHLGHSNSERAGVRAILSAVCGAVQQATMLDVFSFAPAKSNILANVEAASDPYAETERLIRQTCGLLSPRNLILVMDDFDAVAHAFASQPALSDFLDFLEHLFMAIKNFNVVFVSQFSPVLFEENARHAFAGTARLHHLGPLERKDIGNLLRPPDFPLYFSDTAIDAIHKLSGGHPYLAQLLAYYAVRRFNLMANDQLGEPLIEFEDIQEVLDAPEVVQRAQILFQRMDLLARRAGGRAESLLDAISESRDGLNRTELLHRFGSGNQREAGVLDTMLFRLKRYGMIEEDAEGRWRLRNELWRKWEEGRLALPPPEEMGAESEIVEEDGPHDTLELIARAEELEPAREREPQGEAEATDAVDQPEAFEAETQEAAELLEPVQAQNAVEPMPADQSVDDTLTLDPEELEGEIAASK